MRRAGFFAGLLAASVMVLAQFGLQMVTELPSAPVLVAERIASLLPGELFSSLIDLLQFSAKPLLLAGVAFGEILLGGFCGLVYARAWDRSVLPRRIRDWSGDPPASRLGIRGGITFSAIVWLFFELLVLLWIGGEPPGVPGIIPILTRGLSLFVYGVVLAAGYGYLVRPHASPAGPFPAPEALLVTRAQLLRWIGASAVAIAAGGVAVRLVEGRETRAHTGRRGLTDFPPAITPTPDFYTVSKNFIDPAVDGKSWRLKVDGLVDEPFELTYQELKALPFRSHIATLLCISNEVGGDLISNGEWTVTSLGDLIARAQPQAGIRDVVLHAADGYVDSIALDQALADDCVIAWELNGEPLTVSHGYPARLLVPGIYGMKNVKWLTSIELSNRDEKGFWQSRGWSDIAAIRSMSRIDFPAGGSSVSGPIVRIGGIAFCGDRGIQAVELSDDAGKSWSNATLQPPLSKLAWGFWTYDWEPRSRGEHRLVVRAIDGEGTVQAGVRTPPFPNGATGHHTIGVRVTSL